MSGGSPARTVGGAVMELIAAYGVRTVFGIPGTHNLEFYRPLGDLDIRAVTTRHEQGAGYAADGWAQQTGLPGVVITTSGPGLLNVLSAAGTAYCESRPLLILSPGIARGERFAANGALHETKDPVGAVGSVVAWSRRAESADDAVAAVHDAFTLFRRQRPLPVHLEIPLDLLEEAAADDLELTPRPAGEPASADPAVVAAAVAALEGAKRPVILAGGGSTRATAPLQRLAECLDAVVLTTLNGKGSLPEDHPLSAGSDIRLPETQAACEDADVLLVLGSKVGDAELWFARLHPRGTVIRVDRDPDRIHTNLCADLGLVGDIEAVLPQLLAGLGTGRVGGGSGADRAAAVRDRSRCAAEAMAPHLARFCADLLPSLPPETILAGDSSQVTYLGTASLIPQRVPHALLYTPAYATLGYGLPAAIGAAVAAPERPVVCVVGDGALMFAIQELATAVEQGIDVVVICADNGGYGEIRQNQIDRGIEPVGVDLHQPDWAALATAFGGYGRRLTSHDQLARATCEALRAGGVQLIHAPLDLWADLPREATSR